MGTKNNESSSNGSFECSNHSRRRTTQQHDVEGGQLARIRELLLNGADVNCVGCNTNTTSSNKKWTPLAYACYHGHLELTKLLLQHGANTNGTRITQINEEKKTNDESSTDAPLYCAVLNSQLEVVEYLLGRSDINVNIVNSVGETPLYTACMYGSVSGVLERLLQHKDCDVNRTNIFGETPLFAACRHGRVWIVRLLLKYGANVDQGRTTPLCVAALHEHKNIVRLLLQHNANIIVKDQNGVYPSSSSKSSLSSSKPTSLNTTIPTTTNPYQIPRRNASKMETLSSSSSARKKTFEPNDKIDNTITTNTPKKKKKQSYKSMMASMMTSSTKKQNREEEIRKVTGGGIFSKVDKI